MSAGQPVEGTTIAWIDGRWGAAAELSLPLLDRGLLLADGLFETMLVQAGRPQLLEQHLERWSRSAAELAMAPPPGQAALAPCLLYTSPSPRDRG